jgi:hypothetical protein
MSLTDDWSGHGGLAVGDRAVTAADRLSVPVDRNGGIAAELTPQP